MEIAKLFDAQVRTVSQEVGQLGETRLFLMGALLLADELGDLKARFARADAELTRLRESQADIEQRAVQALEAATAKIEALGA